MSGAGKSTVKHALEDFGYFCVTNLPIDFITQLAEFMKNSGKYKKVAIILDFRDEESYLDLLNSLKSMDNLKIKYKLMFVDASDDVLINRYKQTRFEHPFESSDIVGIQQAILAERKLLSSVRAKADYFIDTSGLSVYECIAKVKELFSENDKDIIHISCVSFGFKYSAPKDADFIFDVRFLPNPYYIPELKNLTGIDSRVRDYVMNFEQSKQYEKILLDLVDCAVSLCKKEGRSQLTFAFGCTGGHHRSVVFAQRIYEHLKPYYFSSVTHRDINK